MNIKRRKRPKMGVRQDNAIRCQSHLAYVRLHECAISRQHECTGKIEAHHVRLGSHTGMGQKPDDSLAVPLCSEAHRLLHDVGAETFERKHALTLITLAGKLWLNSPHRIKWEQKQQQAQAEHSAAHPNSSTNAL